MLVVKTSFCDPDRSTSRTRSKLRNQQLLELSDLTQSNEVFEVMNGMDNNVTFNRKTNELP